MADACIFIANRDFSPELYTNRPLFNIGTGEDITIKDLAELIKDIVGYEGDMVLDTSKPDGTPQKLLDVSRMSALGWQARISLENGIRQTYKWFKVQSLGAGGSRLANFEL